MKGKAAKEKRARERESDEMREVKERIHYAN